MASRLLLIQSSKVSGLGRWSFLTRHPESARLCNTLLIGRPHSHYHHPSAVFCRTYIDPPSKPTTEESASPSMDATAATAPHTSFPNRSVIWPPRPQQLQHQQHQKHAHASRRRWNGASSHRSWNGNSSSNSSSSSNNNNNRRRSPPSLLHEEPTNSGQQQNNDTYIPVQAIHIAQTIDLSPVISTLFAKDSIRKQMFNRNSFVVQFPSSTNDGDDTTTQKPQYLAVFRFGSIVAFNLSPQHLQSIVQDMKKHATEPVVAGFERREKFGVWLQQQQQQQQPSDEQQQQQQLEQPEQPQEPTTLVTGDYCVVPEIDMNGVSVISTIMAQTVALDSYNDIVDDLLAHFAKINAHVTKTGKFNSTDKEFLFKTVAQNNSIFIDMISKIRIKDRSDTAWNMTKYEDIHYGMKEEFEIDDRFDMIDFKLNLIQQNAKFFVEVLQSQKSNSLEWIIVVLIALECGIMCMDMSGLGSTVLAPLLGFWNLTPDVPPTITPPASKSS